MINLETIIRWVKEGKLEWSDDPSIPLGEDYVYRLKVLDKNLEQYFIPDGNTMLILIDKFGNHKE